MTQLVLTDHGDRLTASVEGHQLKVEYGWSSPGVMRVDFVEVPRALGGRGLGTKLVAALVDKARTDGFKLEPVCGFARHQLAKHSQWHDVLNG